MTFLKEDNDEHNLIEKHLNEIKTLENNYFDITSSLMKKMKYQEGEIYQIINSIKNTSDIQSLKNIIDTYKISSKYFLYFVKILY